MKYVGLILLLVLNILSSCHNDESPEQFIKPKKEEVEIQNPSVATSKIELPVSTIEKQFIDAGLVDIQRIDSSIIVDLKYSTCDNFLCSDMYGDLSKCYLQPDVVQKLKRAQEILRSSFPYYSLVIFDGVRPRIIQLKMWDTMNIAASERSKFISNPRNGSLHNFGAAVDLSIIDANGILMDMGTPYDYFGELAYPREELRMLHEGKLTYKQFLNRKILRDVMLQAGFMNITTEWWHFNSCSRNDAFFKYKIIE